MIRLFLFLFLTASSAQAQNYRLHCEVHTIVSVYYDGTFSIDEQKFTSDLMVTIIDHPLWAKIEDIKMNAQVIEKGILFSLEHVHPAKDGRFIQIKVTPEESTISQDYGSVFFGQRNAYCNITPTEIDANLLKK